MRTTIAEIAPGIYRLSTFVPNVGPTGFTFNQFLIDADEPLLFHYGQRSLFPLIVEAVKTVIPLDKLRWTTCSHVEGDESGALNQWLAAAPNARPAHGPDRLQHLALRHGRPTAPRAPGQRGAGPRQQARALARHAARAAQLGRRPDLRGNDHGTLFSSDLFTQVGPADPTTESDIVAPAIAVAERLPFMPPTPMAAPTLRRLATLKPTTIALMHGPTFKGDGAAALEGWRSTT